MALSTLGGLALNAAAPGLQDLSSIARMAVTLCTNLVRWRDLATKRGAFIVAFKQCAPAPARHAQGLQ